MDVSTIFANLLISLGLGLLVGLQRERTQRKLGGIRTFGLVTLSGSLCALLTLPPLGIGGWTVAAGFLALAAIIAAASRSAAPDEEPSHGVTTEVAMLAMFAVGAYVILGPREAAVAVGAAIAILLHAKPILHGFVARLGDTDVRAIMQFALISLIILPVVPDRTFGPYDVLNPAHIWLMVVLVVGISLGGYIVYKFVGGGAGILLGGLLGGLVSSTATSVSYARRAASSPEYVGASTAVILIASTVVYGRVLVEIGLVAPGFLPVAAGPIGVLAAVSAILAFFCWRNAQKSGDDLPKLSNPTELGSALFFAGLYALVLVAVAAAKDRFGQSGLYAVAAISGLTDMDAITLSVSRMVNQAQPSATPAADMSTAWRAIVIAAMSNAVFKGIIIATLGSAALGKRVAFFFGIKLAVAIAVLALWPR